MDAAIAICGVYGPFSAGLSFVTLYHWYESAGWVLVA
jgi:hypothetical protein